MHSHLTIVLHLTYFIDSQRSMTASVVTPAIEKCFFSFWMVIQKMSLVLLQTYSICSPEPRSRRPAQPGIYRPKRINVEIGEAQNNSSDVK